MRSRALVIERAVRRRRARFLAFISGLVTVEQTETEGAILVVTNMWPSQENAAYGVFVNRQVRSLTRLGLPSDVVFIRGYRTSLAYALAVAVILRMRFLSGKSYRLVHAHGGEAGLVARFALRTPLVVSYCGDDLLGTFLADGSLTRKSRLSRAIIRQHSRFAAATITKSREMEQCLPPCVRRRNSVIPNGIDREAFHPVDRAAARKRLGWPQDRRVALFAADPAVPRKRFWLAVAAVERAREVLPDLELRVAADVRPAKVPEMMNAADCLLLTSVAEGSPNVVKEAVSCGLPVVSTDVGDVAEVLASVEPSYVCPPDVGPLARAIVDCVRQPKRSNGRDVSGWLSLERIAARIANVYAAIAPVAPITSSPRPAPAVNRSR